MRVAVSDPTNSMTTTPGPWGSGSHARSLADARPPGPAPCACRSCGQQPYPGDSETTRQGTHPRRVFYDAQRPHKYPPYCTASPMSLEPAQMTQIEMICVRLRACAE